jgi:hypothetical protein
VARKVIRLNARRQRQPDPDAFLLTIGQTARRYHLAESTVRRWVRTGALPDGVVVVFPSGWTSVRAAPFDRWIRGEAPPVSRPREVSGA